MSREILRLYQADELFAAKEQMMDEMNVIANVAMNAMKMDLAKNLFGAPVNEEELDEDQKKK